MELRTYLDFLRRRWLLLALGPLLAGFAAYMVSQQLTPVYSATATLLVNRTAVPNLIDYNDILTSERLTNTYAQLVERPAVLDNVKTRLSLELDRSVLEKKISTSPIKETQLIRLSVNDADPVFAAQLANTTALAFTEDNASQLAGAGSVTIAKPADVPETPVSPNVLFNVAFAVLLGGVAVACISLLLDYLDDTVKTAEDIETVSGLTTLGSIGRFKAETGPAFARDQHSRTAEAYRQLRTNVHFIALGSPAGAGLKTMVITSANPEEGKSTTAANLATVLAQAGDRVILVDTDLRRSSLRKTFDAQQSFGLTGLLLNDIQDPSLALVATRWKNLQLLPAGVLPPNPSELLTSARMVRVIQMLRQMADYVIFDSPPILAVTDAIVLAGRTDGTILVTEAGGTRSETLRQVARTLKQANARVIGVVLNKAKVAHSGGYYYRDDEEQPVELSPDAPRQEAKRAVAAASLATPRPVAPTTIAEPEKAGPAPTAKAIPVARTEPLPPVIKIPAPISIEPSAVQRVAAAPPAPVAKPEPARAAASENRDAFLEHRLAALRDRYQANGSPDMAAAEPAAHSFGYTPPASLPPPPARRNGNGHSAPPQTPPTNGNGHTAPPVAKVNGNGNGRSTPPAPASNGNGHTNGNGHAEAPHTKPVTNGNGHGNGHAETPRAKTVTNGNGSGNGHSAPLPVPPAYLTSAPALPKPNGNGNGHAAPLQQLPPLSPEMSDLLARLDDTVGMIRSLKPQGDSELV